MLPATCRKPPWRNIEVITVGHEKYAGTRPNEKTKLLIASPSES